MKIKLSATFEGKCNICREEKIVFTAGDEDTKKTVTVCKECSAEMGEKPTSEVIEEHGRKDKESFKEGVNVEEKSSAS